MFYTYFSNIYFNLFNFLITLSQFQKLGSVEFIVYLIVQHLHNVYANDFWLSRNINAAVSRIQLPSQNLCYIVYYESTRTPISFILALRNIPLQFHSRFKFHKPNKQFFITVVCTVLILCKTFQVLIHITHLMYVRCSKLSSIIWLVVFIV